MRWISLIIVVSVSAYLLVGTMTLRPLREGDGCEYAQMTESFVNHLSPDARPEDLAPLARWCPGFRVDVTPPYFLGSGGRRYSFHFWAYSLVAVPVKLVLRTLGTNELMTFQISNALLLIVALSCVLFLLPWDRVWRVVLGLLSLIGPAFWFVHWPHPEVYSYALVTMALVFMTRSAWTIAGGLAGLASWQNSPLVALVVLIIIKALRERASPTQKTGAVVVAVATTAVPYVDSLVKFGTPSLLAKYAAGPEHITLTRVIELFVDPNIGMLPYIPLALLLFIGVVGRDILVGRRLSFGLELFTILVAMAVGAASTGNWNHGTSGPTRYAVWMLPLVFFGVVESATRSQSPRGRHVWLLLLAAAVATQAVILYATSDRGGFVSRISYLDHTRLAKLVLRTAPSLYNPTPELFTERTVHREDTDTFAVFFDRRRCRKALLRPDDRDLLEAVCGTLPAPVDTALARARDLVPFYVTFPRRTPPAPPGAEEAASGRLSVARWLDSGVHRATAASRPGVTLRVNQPAFAPGAFIQLSLRIERLSAVGQGDLYAGIVASYGNVATVRSDGRLAIRSRFVGLLPSMRTRPIDLSHGLEIPVLLMPVPVAVRDLPAGDYQAFAVVTTSRAAPGRTVSPNDVIAADVKTFRVER